MAPDLGEFMALTVECGANPFRVNVADVLAEYKRGRNESYRYSSSTEFPWRQPVLYHICIEMRRAGVEKRMTARELERLAERLLTTWIKHAGNGLSVPPPACRTETSWWTNTRTADASGISSKEGCWADVIYQLSNGQSLRCQTQSNSHRTTSGKLTYSSARELFVRC